MPYTHYDAGVAGFGAEMTPVAIAIKRYYDCGVPLITDNIGAIPRCIACNAIPVPIRARIGDPVCHQVEHQMHEQLGTR